MLNIAGERNYGRAIVRELWWSEHKRLLRLMALGLGAIVGAVLWSMSLHYALAAMVGGVHWQEFVR